MRRALVVIVLSSAATTGAVLATVPSWASHGSTHAHSHDHDRARSEHVATSLTNPRVLAHYGFGAGRLVAAEVCVRNTCVHRTYGPAPTCAPAPATCIGTTLFVRRFPSGMTISVELAAD
jgi:hypothetical protein